MECYARNHDNENCYAMSFLDRNSVECDEKAKLEAQNA